MSTPNEMLQFDWDTNPRWQNTERPYTPEDVLKLRNSVKIEYTLAKLGSERLWRLLNSESYVNSLGAMTGNQAVQQVAAGLKAIYVSGWQTAADANVAGQMYPDQSLYPANSVPELIKRINNALMRADQVQNLGEGNTYWFAPMMADAEAGFGGNLNTFELTKSMIEAGVAGIHYEDQLSSAKKCGHMGGKVLVPTQEAVNKLVSARLAADVMDVPIIIAARTDAEAATLITSDIDERDRHFINADAPRTSEGFYEVRNGLESAIARGLSYAPYADLVWCETKHPDLEEARQFAEAIHSKYPDKMLMYNCSPSFNWSRHLDATTIAKFQRELGAMGYKFQFITLAGFHALNLSMFELALGYREQGMTAYSALQDREFALEQSDGYKAVKHQAFVGTGYFDAVQNIITMGQASTTAMSGSTEEEQFTDDTLSAVGD
ncbi:MAG: isocitrate lyase [Anaerolineae bacterium]